MTYGLADVVQQRRLIDQSEASDDVQARVAPPSSTRCSACARRPAAAACACSPTSARRARPAATATPASSRRQTWDATDAAQQGALGDLPHRPALRRGAPDRRAARQGRRAHRALGARPARRCSASAPTSTKPRGAASSASSSRSGSRSVDHEAHGALKLTEASRAGAEGRADGRDAARRSRARRDGAAAARARRGRGSAAGATPRCFERLKAWRRAEARAQGVPAYVILHDSTLAEIARRRPRDARRARRRRRHRREEARALRRRAGRSGRGSLTAQGCEGQLAEGRGLSCSRAGARRCECPDADPWLVPTERVSSL